MSSALAASPLRLLPTLAELRSLVVDYVELDDLFALALSCGPLRATVCLRGGAFARFPNGLRTRRLEMWRSARRLAWAVTAASTAASASLAV